MEEETTGKWTAFGLVAIGVFMATLDSSIVNISLPTIAAYFHVPLSGAIAWVIIAYLVVIAGCLLPAGRSADLLGRKALWISGLGIFTFGSALSGAASSLPLLIVFRALRGEPGDADRRVSAERERSGARAQCTDCRTGSERGTYARRHHHREAQLALDLLRQSAAGVDWDRRHGIAFRRAPTAEEGAI
jgi:hypothetical protein